MKNKINQSNVFPVNNKMEYKLVTRNNGTHFLKIKRKDDKEFTLSVCLDHVIDQYLEYSENEECDCGGYILLECQKCGKILPEERE